VRNVQGVWENFAIFDWNHLLSWKQYEIGLCLLWNVNRKSYEGFEENVDVHLYKNFPQVSKFASVVQKRLGMNKFVRTKSHTGSKFSKATLGLLCKWGIVVVHLYCGFSMWCQMAPHQTAKFRSAFFVIFPSLRKDSVASYPWIWTLAVRGLDLLYNALNVSYSFVGRWRHEIHKFAAEIFQNAKKSAAELCQILRVVTVEIVINSIGVMGRACSNILPVLYCEVMLLF